MDDSTIKIDEAVRPRKLETLPDFNKMVYYLLDAVKEPTVKSLIVNSERIHELAELCRVSPLYKEYIDLNASFCKDKTAVDLYKWMVYKIVHAPMKLLADGTVILFMPSISDALKKEEPTEKKL